MVCRNPVAGASPAGKVCRASHPAAAPLQGIQVLRDGADRWVNSRTIWNQHAYAVTHIDEHGVVPRTSQWKQNWKDPKLNNFRMNVQGSLPASDAPDITASGNGADFECGAGSETLLRARVCNRGTAPLPSGVPATFYADSKDPANKACTAKTTKLLPPGKCEVFSCSWTATNTVPVDVVIWADDDGTGASTFNECEEGNNLGMVRQVLCPAVR